MDESSWQVIGIIFSIALGVISLLYTASQTRFAAKQMRSATSTTVFGYLTQLNGILLDNADLEAEYLGGNYFGAVDTKTRKAQLLVDIYLSFVEEVWYQHDGFRQYTAKDWETWERLLVHLGRSYFVRNYWNKARDNFDSDFIEIVDRAFKATEQRQLIKSGNGD